MTNLPSSTADLDSRFPFLPSERHALTGSQDTTPLHTLHRALREGGNIETIADPQVRRAAALLLGQEGNVGSFLDAPTALMLARHENVNPRVWERLTQVRDAQTKLIRKTLSGKLPTAIQSDHEKSKQFSSVVPALEATVPLHRALNQSVPGLFEQVALAEKRADESGIDSYVTKEYGRSVQLFSELVHNPHLFQLYGDDLPAMMRACYYVSERPDANVVLTVGFGGSPDPVTVRTPSYIVPALEMMNVFHKYRTDAANPTKAMPRLRVFQGLKLSKLVNNGFDPQQLEKAGRVRMGFLKAFVDEFAPHLAPHVVFEDDDTLELPTEEEAVARYGRVQWPKQFVERYEERKAGTNTEKGRVDGTIEEVRRRSIHYLASHPAVFLDELSGSHPTLGLPDAVWSLGGSGERDFNVGRIEFAKLRKEEGSNLYMPEVNKLLLSIGTFPAYYQNEVDIPVHELNGQPIEPRNQSQWAQRAKAATADYNALFSFVAASAFSAEEPERARSLAEEKLRAFCHSFAYASQQ